MLGSQFFCVIFQHIWVKDALVFVVMHDHWFYSRIQDLNGGFAIECGFLDGELCHTFKESGKCLLSGNEVAEGVEDQHIVTVIVGHAAIWLKDMGMSADYDVNALFHKEGCPFFFVFSRHRFFFFTPVCHKDQAVAGSFGFLDHGSDFIFIKDVDHVFFAFSCTRVVGSVCIIEERNSDTIYFDGFDRIRIFLGIVDSKYWNRRIFLFPEFQCLIQIVKTVIINVIGSRFDYIKTCIDKGIAYFCWSGKRWIGAYCIMVCGEYGFLVNHGYVSSLDLIFYFFVDFVVIPVAGIVAACINEASMVEVVPYSDYACCGNFWCFGSFFSFSFLLFFGFFCIVGRLLDEGVVQLVECQHQKYQNDYRADETNSGIGLFFQIQRYIFVFFHIGFLC